MAAITKRLLHVRPNRPHPYPLHHFSSSSDSDTRPDIPQSNPNPRSPSSSTGLYQPQNRRDETHRLLSEFRHRSAAPPPSSAAGISLQELFERNVNPKANPSGLNDGVKRSIDMIRSTLASQNEKVTNRWSKFQLNDNLKPRATLAGGKEDFLPPFLRTDLGLTRDYKDLGNRLKKLRPENRKGKWFSLQELSVRFAKLNEAEKKEREASVAHGLRDGILKQGEKKEHKPMQTFSYIGTLVGTQSYDLSPPKNDLVEKYFHPDHMSSAEKLKLELKKVRDEFKMSESDCGSARVQVAQLTTKIKHLSSVLKKKDKHSRRGLQAMVQRRKKLLKYVRRTDWDSYCLILSKFGFRDNPDLKA